MMFRSNSDDLNHSRTPGLEKNYPMGQASDSPVVSSYRALGSPHPLWTWVVASWWKPKSWDAKTGFKSLNHVEPIIIWKNYGIKKWNVHVFSCCLIYIFAHFDELVREKGSIHQQELHILLSSVHLPAGLVHQQETAALVPSPACPSQSPQASLGMQWRWFDIWRCLWFFQSRSLRLHFQGLTMSNH